MAQMRNARWPANDPFVARGKIGGVEPIAIGGDRHLCRCSYRIGSPCGPAEIDRKVAPRGRPFSRVKRQQKKQNKERKRS